MPSKKWHQKYAGVAELADALDLGSSVTHVQVQVLSPAPESPQLFEDFYFFKILLYCNKKLLFTNMNL